MSYGTDNVILDRDAGDRVHFDPAVCIIRAGETGLLLIELISRNLGGARDRARIK